MVDKTNLQKIVTSIDVFRFTIKKDEVSKLQTLINETICDQSNQSATNRPIASIPCLNLSSKLIEKKIIDVNDNNAWDNLQPILFERLMIEDYNAFEQFTLNIPRNSPILFANNDPGESSTAFDCQILKYLYGCFYRVQNIRDASRTKESSNNDFLAFLAKVESIILDQVLLYLTEPDLFPDRDKRYKNNQPSPLLLNLVYSRISSSDPVQIDTIQKFVYHIGELCKSSGDSAIESIIAPTYNRLCQKLVTLAIDDISLPDYFEVVKVFIQHPELSKKIIEKMTLKQDNSLSYQSTLLGFMLSISHLPKTSQIEPTFFIRRTGDAERRSTEQMLGLKLHNLGKELHKIFHLLLKTSQTRTLFLTWLGRCLHTFKDRKKMWNNQILMATSPISVNDGFLMNVFTAMLHLSEPFVGPYNLERVGLTTTYSMNPKMLKIDPRYCKWSKSSHHKSATHFLGLSEETFLINVENQDESSDKNEVMNYEPNFISECFFGTHLAFSYGFRSVNERYIKLSQNISEYQQTYNEIMVNPVPSHMSNMDPLEMIKEKIDNALTQLLNLKAVLTEPNRVKMQVHFCLATASYINHLVACQSYEDAVNATEPKTITLQMLKEEKFSRSCLEYIPEMLIENILDSTLFLLFYNEEMYKEVLPLFDPIMTTVITFMGNPSLMQNPHLRVKFAEVLELLMPHPSHHTGEIIGSSSTFTDHPLSEMLIPSLLNVFVSIEMTGEGVQFEQKFTYRRPMYLVLQYLYGHDKHRAVLISLAEEAEQNIDSSRPPLFLKFINLLMNDAIFVLDEALSYMTQLKEAEQRRKTEEWRKLSFEQRSQAEANFNHTGRVARFHNVLSLSTIGTLAWLTKDIKTIFSHPTLVDRIANMLNYFLEHLVGPKKKNFIVTDKNDYEFNPRAILGKICEIYVNLGDTKNLRYIEFCTAVSSDGRSYHENLLPQATEILFRTGMSSLGTEFDKLSKLIDKIAIQNQMEEIPSEDIPDTFLDPIMSTLMVDPVLLPSSKIVVDRSTIARHLLSDQTDPFNRSPLSMEDVIPQEDIRRQIQGFLRERREAQQHQHSSNEKAKNFSEKKDTSS